MIEHLLYFCWFQPHHHICTTLDYLDNIMWCSFLLPTKLDTIINHLMFYCSCEHPDESHYCDCGVTYCTECIIGTESIISFHHRMKVKNICLGAKSTS